MFTIQIRGIGAREPHAILDFIWRKAERVLATDGAHPPLFFVFAGGDVTLFDVRAEIGSAKGKDEVALLMHRIALAPRVEAIAFVSEAWAIDHAQPADIAQAATVGLADHPRRREVLYASVETRGGAAIARQAEIVRDEVSIELRGQEDLAGIGTDSRFGGYFPQAEA